MSLIPYVKMARPLNCAMAAFATMISAFIVVGMDITGSELYIPLLVGMGIAAGFTKAGNYLNDYTDREGDKINHPERPIPSGQVSPDFVLYASLMIFFIGSIVAFFINYIAFVIVVSNAVIMIAYEFKTKHKGLPGNLSISWLTGTTFIFGGAVVGNIYPVLVLALLAFFATMGREIVKDIEDIKGDKDRFTLPMRVGVGQAGVLAATFFFIRALLSTLPYILGMFDAYYLAAVLLADVTFIYCAGLLFNYPGKVSKVSKIGMLLGMLAFLFGSIMV